MATTFAMTYPQASHLAPIFRTESATWYQTQGELQASYVEKRQLFLRSYQFSRKQSLSEKLKGSLVRVKRLFWVRLRSARKLRRVVWSGLRYALYNKRRRLSRLVNYYYNNNNTKRSKKYKYELFQRCNSSSSCLC